MKPKITSGEKDSIHSGSDMADANIFENLGKPTSLPNPTEEKELIDLDESIWNKSEDETPAPPIELKKIDLERLIQLGVKAENTVPKKAPVNLDLNSRLMDQVINPHELFS